MPEVIGISSLAGKCLKRAKKGLKEAFDILAEKRYFELLKIVKYLKIYAFLFGSYYIYTYLWYVIK